MLELLQLVFAVFAVIGAGFVLLAAIGLVRLDDVYSRMHATTKAATLGAGLILLSTGLASGQGIVIAKAFAAVTFILATAPVSAHLFSRASIKFGAREKSVVNALTGKYEQIGDMPRGFRSETPSVPGQGG
ncbi:MULTISPECIES: monovalent cation/H(+) antiporter subunit G [unclassified Roseitalea]|uniref:monovalent cation/H(+) antiporter subunit G n=1 Tax=unclassified Roseitalea TaxID=2639107 RepID=UPI00273FFF11|nr:MULTISPECIES: monovalent cation/H(+) antiporter subunit G [unclassified Roseitalea]